MEWKRELQNAAKEGRVVLGTNKVLDALREKTGEFVVLAKDGLHYEKLLKYAKLSGATIHEVEKGYDLGASVKKPFRVSAILVLKSVK